MSSTGGLSQTGELDSSGIRSGFLAYSLNKPNAFARVRKVCEIMLIGSSVGCWSSTALASAATVGVSAIGSSPLGNTGKSS